MENKGKFDDILGVKHTIRSIFASFTGAWGAFNHTIGFLRAKDHSIDTFIFVAGLRLDLADHSVVADAFVLTLSEDLVLAGGIEALDAAEGFPLLKITLVEEELRVWKQLLPALAERSRADWQHGADCKYLSQGGIPSHLGFGMDPLCHCGWGKKTEAAGMDSARTVCHSHRTEPPVWGTLHGQGIVLCQTCSRGRKASVRCLRGRGKTKTPHVHSM